MGVEKGDSPKMNTTSSLAKLGLYPKTKPFRVMVLGQSGVGKTGKLYNFFY